MRRILAALLLMTWPAAAQVPGTTVGESVTPAQVPELANLEILSGKALYNSGQLRLDVIRLNLQIADLKSQIEALNARIKELDAKIPDPNHAITTDSLNPVNPVTVPKMPGFDPEKDKP